MNPADPIASDRRASRLRVWSRPFLAIAIMEFWERFAMYGVKSLLVLMLLDRILSGDLGQVLGATALRDASINIFGPMSNTGLASQLYGYANAIIYLSIPAGGLAGDVLRDRRLAVVSGGAGMLLGLMLMLQKDSFLIGLVVFAIGTGLLKGNLSVQLGHLFEDEAERRRAYTVYLGFLNAGAICGPLVCGAMATYAGPTSAIAAAAVAVVIGLASYAYMGRRVTAVSSAQRISSPSIAIPTRTLLIVALAAVYLCFAAYEQVGNIFLVWARTRIDLDLGGWTMPVAWFLSLDGLLTLLLIGGWQVALRTLERRGRGISAVMQMLMGGLLCASGYVILAVASVLEPPLSLGWAFAYLLLIDAAIVLIWPSGLSLIAEVAPARRTGLWMGLFYLHGFFAHLWVGMIGIYYERMATPAFWLLHASIAGGAALLILVAGIPLLHAARGRQAISTSA